MLQQLHIIIVEKNNKNMVVFIPFLQQSFSLILVLICYYKRY